MTDNTPKSWQDTKSLSQTYEKIEHWGNQSLYPSCSNSKSNQLSLKSLKKKRNSHNNFISVSIFIAILFTLASCSIFERQPNPTPTPTPTPTSTSTPTPITTPDLAPPEAFSSGERTFFPGIGNIFRDRGIEEFKGGNYSQAIANFEKAIVSNRNDPEVQIYLNNARARLRSNPFVLAAVVPIHNRQASAKEMLRGIADSQNKFNLSRDTGRLIEIIIANDGNEPPRAASVARKLANNPAVLGVIGHNSSSATKAGLEEYELAGLAVISPTSTSTALNNDVFFRTVPSDDASGEKLAEYALSQGIREIAIFYNPNSSYSTSLFRAFEISFRRSGGNVIGAPDLSKPDLNPKAEIESLRGQVKAIALFPNTATSSVAVSLIIENSNVPGEKFQLLGGDSLFSSDTLISSQGSLEGLVLAIPWFSSNQSYAQEAARRWQGTVNWRTASSFDATQAFVNVLSRNNEANRSSVLENLPFINLESSETSEQPLKFTTNGNRESDPILVEVSKDTTARPAGVEYGFKKIE